MEPLKEQRWRLTRQSGSKLRALQTLPRGSVAPSNIEAADMDRDIMMREAFGVRDACFRFAMKPVKLSDEPCVRRGSSPPKSEMLRIECGPRLGAVPTAIHASGICAAVPVSPWDNDRARSRSGPE